MHVNEQGSGPPVILLHGLGAHSFSWRTTQAALTGHRTYALDLTGFGRSVPPASFAYTMAAQARAVADLILRKGLTSPAIVGHSLGGGICLRLAERAGQPGWPDIGRMVLVAPLAYPPAQAFPALGAQLPAGGDPLARVDPVVSRGMAELFLRKAYAPTSPVTQAQIDGYAEGLSKLYQIAAFRRHTANLGEITTAPVSPGAVGVRTLVIWGDLEPILVQADGRRLAAALPDADYREITACGHVPQEEQPRDTNDAIRQFLA